MGYVDAIFFGKKGCYAITMRCNCHLC